MKNTFSCITLTKNAGERLPYMQLMTVTAVYALYIAGLILCLAR
jgi:hypothetical protein